MARFFATSRHCMRMMPELTSELLVSGVVAITVPFLLNAFAKSNQTTSLATTFHKHEGEKHRAYEECVWEV